MHLWHIVNRKYGANTQRGGKKSPVNSSKTNAKRQRKTNQKNEQSPLWVKLAQKQLGMQ